MTTTNLIEAKGLHKEFVLPNETVVALKDVSFVVQKTPLMSSTDHLVAGSRQC